MQHANADIATKISSRRFAFDLFLQLAYAKPDKQGNHGYRNTGDQIRIDVQT
jgi:hypothetical protein